MPGFLKYFRINLFQLFNKMRVGKSTDKVMRIVTNSCYLLGVYDKTRRGALRFKLRENGDFVSDEVE